MRVLLHNDCDIKNLHVVINGMDVGILFLDVGMNVVINGMDW